MNSVKPLQQHFVQDQCIENVMRRTYVEKFEHLGQRSLARRDRTRTEIKGLDWPDRWGQTRSPKSKPRFACRENLLKMSFS
jgi:hypothetical protein